MKIKSSLFTLFFLLIVCAANAQDTLNITVNGNEPTKSKLQLNGEEPLSSVVGKDNSPKGNKWSFHVQLAPNCKVKISNGKDTLLVDSPKDIQVKNNQMAGVNWVFKDLIIIQTIGTDNLVKKTYTIEYAPQAKTDVYYVGSMVYDAWYLKNGTDNGIKIKILGYYAQLKDVTTTTIKDAYKGNELISVKVDSICDKANTPQSSDNKFLGLPTSLSALGGLDVTNIADGLARFIVTRTKQELNAAFFDNMRETLNDTAYRDFQDLFPQTLVTLNVIGDQVYNYTVYLQSLRESFEKDLQDLPENLPEIIGNHEKFFKKYPSLAATLRGGCYVASSLQEKIHPGEIIREFPDSLLNALDPACTATLHVTQLFSESLRDTTKNDGHYWVKAGEVKNMLADTAVFRFYLGLVNEVALRKYDGLKFSPTVSVSQILNTASKNKAGLDKDFRAYRSYAVTLAQKAENLDSMITAYSKPMNDSLKIELYYTYFEASVDLMQYGLEFGKLPHVNLPDLKEKTKAYFDVADLTAGMFLDVNRRNYSSAIIGLVGLYDIILKENVPAMPKEIAVNEKASKEEKAAKKQSEAAKEKATADIAKANQANAKTETIQQRLLKYGTFMATVVQADNSEEMSEAIEAFALPPGSARIKRESAFNVSLNAYCGLYTGYERINGVDSKWNGRMNSYGLTAPFGIAASWGRRHWCCDKLTRYHSNTIFFSVIDIGALASFRFENDTIAQVPTIQLRDIVSPGLFYSYGFAKIPVSLNFGMQIGPNLRKVNSPNATSATGFNDYQDKIYYRYSVSICVDIPVLNFYTKEAKLE